MIEQILIDYYDRCYITSLLCELSSNYFQFIYNIIIFPTIISSSLLTVLNSSSLDAEYTKIINISLNGIITFILAINSNLKFNDRALMFKTSRIKFNLLTHKLESLINKKKVDPNMIIDIDAIISEYDEQYNNITYIFPNHIRRKIIIKYGGIKKLPNSLQLECESPSVHHKRNSYINNKLSISTLGNSTNDIILVNNNNKV